MIWLLFLYSQAYSYQPAYIGVITPAVHEFVSAEECRTAGEKLSEGYAIHYKCLGVQKPK